MLVTLSGVVTVLLPGTGSDDDYLRRAFGGPLRDAGAAPLAVPPRGPGRSPGLIAGYRDALDRAAAAGPIAVGGVSLGAAVAAEWALARPDRAVAVLAALPAWTGFPGDAPAALSARQTAAQLRRDGLAVTTEAMRSSSPPWLATELARSWSRQWPTLPEALEEATAYVAPTAAELGGLRVPLAVVAASDDPIHPPDVAREWAAAAPRAALRWVSLAQFGPCPELLGEACLDALGAVS